MNTTNLGHSTAAEDRARIVGAAQSIAQLESNLSFPLNKLVPLPLTGLLRPPPARPAVCSLHTTLAEVGRAASAC
ncbi:hypothetical protein E2C01_038142 [Portunus trituberculatus]|uniref:Uncharacterized protein n=1 Tax=Portunus trituberculatus TaxID=210409 RepID=A0A5B7FGT9_PORTR|nr:hypothetical protein [Portunus trituberculatus]